MGMYGNNLPNILNVSRVRLNPIFITLYCFFQMSNIDYQTWHVERQILNVEYRKSNLAC